MYDLDEMYPLKAPMPWGVETLNLTGILAGWCGQSRRKQDVGVGLQARDRLSKTIMTNFDRLEKDHIFVYPLDQSDHGQNPPRLKRRQRAERGAKE